MASIVQLFYNVNFFHDWYYDSGFNEISGNGQMDNYGRGGVDGDSLRAEAQDSSGRNNANMSTPADGGRPRMQMFLFDGLADRKIAVSVTPDPARLPVKDFAPVGSAVFGPVNFVTPGEIVWATGTGGSHDGCDGTNANAPIPNVAGKIAFIDRGGSCAGGFAQKYQNAVLGGASGVIIGNIASSGNPGTAPNMGGTPVGAQTIGILRYPYSTDLTKNPLTYRNIADGQALPNTALLNGVIDDGRGINNAEVHNTGEIWASMLWECYASLLNNGALTFDAAQKRMKDILVTAYKMTPNDPTLLEARDAVLAAAHSFDPLDYTLCNAAFDTRA